jgi:predicted regulator of Ras-like GTPase activity (Roadblock/LC7/MglB family)
VLTDLAAVDQMVGALMVAPDGLVVATTLPGSFPVEPLAALAATLGRELELGADRLGRGSVRTAGFVSAGGSLFIGSTRLGFLVLVGQEGVDAVRARTALREAVTRLGPVVRPA